MTSETEKLIASVISRVADGYAVPQDEIAGLIQAVRDADMAQAALAGLRARAEKAERSLDAAEKTKETFRIACNNNLELQRKATAERDDALTRLADADMAQAMLREAAQDQERNYLHLHSAAYDVWKWFETARPDLIGPRAEKLRDAVMGPRPYGCAALPPPPGGDDEGEGVG